MKKYNSFLNFLDRIFDFVLTFACAYLSYYFVMFTNLNVFEMRVSTMVMSCIVGSLLSSLLYSSYNVYSPMRAQPIRYFLARIFLVNSEIAVLGALIILIFWRTSGGAWYYMTWLMISVGAATFVIMAKKISMMLILHNLRSNSKNIKYILVVTDSQEMVDAYMEELIRNPHFGYSVIGYVGNLSIVGLPHLGTTADLDRVLKEFRPDEVVMAFDTVRKKVITRYIAICNDNCSKVMFVPAICGYFRAPRQVTTMGNIPLIDIRSNPLDNPTNQMIKRIMDIVLSAFLILITSPFMLATAIGVKISSPGPILFRQTRVGRHNKNFTMYKFRSMRVNDTEQTGWSNENDPRKTKFGAFIRKFALDELPQFFNVIKGDMSLVGPRPEVPFYVEQFKKDVPLYMLKHTVRPGITGLAQIKGLRGDTSISDRIDEDINYIENWSFWGDVRILLLTPLKMVNRHEKYVAHETRHIKRQEEKEKRTYVSGHSMRRNSQNADWKKEEEHESH